MTAITLPKDTWVEVATGVDTFNFNLTNWPDATSKRAYLVATGASAPTDDEAAVYYEMLKEKSKSISYSNSSAENIYVKALYSDGKVIY